MEPRRSSTRRIKVFNPLESPPHNSDHKLTTTSCAVSSSSSYLLHFRNLIPKVSLRLIYIIIKFSVNSKGYDMAKKFNNKFSYLLPMGYGIKSQCTKLVMEGGIMLIKNGLQTLE
ncbi:unnamed protein product [Fraxinus pennsylvanica]|uniref:Uncharacterized protein n=1 Tax=Fraxinus pennsylvanica TaxID=56036 RepID=A0AAD1YRW4_9LAMI|nr:unnamed protein product [Fraxinus pennsylvanica]